MRHNDVTVCGAEQAIMELLYAASEPEFKAVHSLIK
jgi:hypothetical protein